MCTNSLWVHLDVNLLPCIAYFHLLLLPFFILWPLSASASSVSWYQSCIVCSGLAYEIHRGGGPSTHVYCVVCYRVISAPYLRNVGHVFACLYTLDDDSEYLMDYETLIPKVFPLCWFLDHHLSFLYVWNWQLNMSWKRELSMTCLFSLFMH